MTFNFAPKGYKFVVQSKADVTRITRLKVRFGDLISDTPDGCEVNVDDMTSLEEHDFFDTVKGWRNANAKS